MIIVSVLHVIVCIALILIILLQAGKGADMGAIFGGGASNTLFGSSGATSFFTKLTTAAAIIFMLTCLSLAWLSSHTSSIMPIKADVPMPASPSGGQKPQTPTAGEADKAQKPESKQGGSAAVEEKAAKEDEEGEGKIDEDKGNLKESNSKPAQKPAASGQNQPKNE